MITKWESGYILKVYIGADFVPTDINRILFENGDMESINLKSPTKTINGFTAIPSLYLAILNYLSCVALHVLFSQGLKNINRN